MPRMPKRTLSIAFMLATLACVARPADAQGTPPTLQDTTAWIRDEGPGIMRAQESQNDRRLQMLSVMEYSATEVRLDECVLSWTAHVVLTVTPTRGPIKPASPGSVIRVPLKDVDMGGVIVTPSTGVLDEITPMYSLRIKTRAGVGATIVERNEGRPDKSRDAISMYVRNLEDGRRLANAVHRAAELCGAPTSAF